MDGQSGSSGEQVMVSEIYWDKPIANLRRKAEGIKVLSIPTLERDWRKVYADAHPEA